MKLSYPVVVLIILLPILTFFLTRGVITHDEGYILHSAEKITEGLMPYRDFSFVYTPLSIFATALSFILFGPSILSSRILVLFVALLSCGFLFYVIRLATKNKFYATLGVLMFIAWGPTHINFSWPVMYATLFALITLFLLLKFLETRSGIFLFLSGIATFAVFLAKQNFGIIMLLPIAVFFLVKHARNIHSILTFSYGYVWSLIIFCIFLLQTDSFAPFIFDFYNYTIRRIILNESITTNFIYIDTLPPMVGRTLFYLLPFIVSAAAFTLLFIRRRFHLLFIPVFVASFYVVGIRPTTDYVHLAPLLALVGLPVSLYLRFNISSSIRMLLLASSLFLILLGFQTALFKGYYRWDEPLTKHNFFLHHEKVNIFLNSKFYNEFRDFQETLNQKTGENDYIFVNSYNPMLYFVTDRKEPTKSNFLKIEIEPREYYDEVVGNLIAKNVEIVILDHNSIHTLPIENFILQNYSFLKTIQDFDIYVKKP